MQKRTLIKDRKVYEILSKHIPKKHFDKLFYLAPTLTSELLCDEVIIGLLHTDRKPKLRELKRIEKWRVLWKK